MFNFVIKLFKYILYHLCKKVSQGVMLSLSKVNMFLFYFTFILINLAAYTAHA